MSIPSHSPDVEGVEPSAPRPVSLSMSSNGNSSALFNHPGPVTLLSPQARLSVPPPARPKVVVATSAVGKSDTPSPSVPPIPSPFSSLQSTPLPQETATVPNRRLPYTAAPPVPPKIPASPRFDDEEYGASDGSPTPRAGRSVLSGGSAGSQFPLLPSTVAITPDAYARWPDRLLRRAADDSTGALMGFKYSQHWPGAEPGTHALEREAGNITYLPIQWPALQAAVPQEK